MNTRAQMPQKYGMINRAANDNDDQQYCRRTACSLSIARARATAVGHTALPTNPVVTTIQKMYDQPNPVPSRVGSNPAAPSCVCTPSKIVDQPSCQMAIAVADSRPMDRTTN